MNETSPEQMDRVQGCQMSGLERIAEGKAAPSTVSLWVRFKRTLAMPWNRRVKPWLKRIERRMGVAKAAPARPASTPLQAGDWVMVKPYEQIKEGLDHWNEVRGCAFLEGMRAYCGTRQRVYQRVERFLDERDYRVKTGRGIILLEGSFCKGTPVFGRCDRSCFYFWREEWLEKVESPGEG